jgi:hypothetical protein
VPPYVQGVGCCPAKKNQGVGPQGAFICGADWSWSSPVTNCGMGRRRPCCLCRAILPPEVAMRQA